MICGGSARSTLNGPPGAKRIRKKEMVTTMKIVGTALSSLRSTKRSIASPENRGAAYVCFGGGAPNLSSTIRD